MVIKPTKTPRNFLMRGATAIIAGTLTIAGLAGCSGDTGATPSDPKSVCFVAEDTGYLTKTIAADFSAHLETHAKEKGLSYQQVSTVKESTKGQCATVITYGDSIADQAIKAAKANPKVNFVIDHAVADESETDEIIQTEEVTDNVKPYTVGIDQAATIAGYLGAGITQSGHVGVIAADKSGSQAAQGFAQGVATYNKAHGTAVEASTDHTDAVDAAKVAEVLAAMKKDKVDIILIAFGEEKTNIADLKGTAQPIIDALAEDKEYKPAIFWVGEDGKSNYSSMKERTISSITIDSEPVAKALVKAISASTFDTEPFYGDLRNGVVSIGGFEGFDAWISDELKKELDDLSNNLTDGHFTLSKAHSDKADPEEKKESHDKKSDDKSKEDASDDKSKDEKSKEDKPKDEKSDDNSDEKSKDNKSDDESKDNK